MTQTPPPTAIETVSDERLAEIIQHEQERLALYGETMPASDRTLIGVSDRLSALTELLARRSIDMDWPGKCPNCGCHTKADIERADGSPDGRVRCVECKSVFGSELSRRSLDTADGVEGQWPLREALKIAEAYIGEYEFDDGEHVFHSPSETERLVMIDMVNGLFSEDDFIKALASPPAQEAVTDAMVVCAMQEIPGVDHDDMVRALQAALGLEIER